MRARGVRFLKEDGAPATATARHEVVVCAGVIGSPQLLLLSGIGPASAFERGEQGASSKEEEEEEEGGWEGPTCKVSPSIY